MTPFAVGSGGGRDIRVYSEGIANVLHAMAAHDVFSLLAVSAAGSFDRKAPELGMGFRAMIATVLKPVYDDMGSGWSSASRPRARAGPS